MIDGSTYSHEFGYGGNIDIQSFSSRLTSQGITGTFGTQKLETKMWR